MASNSLVQTTLDNGLQVLLKESHVAPVATFWIFYRVGSRNELPGTTGASHFVEHMLFKGTEQFPRGEFDKAVARAGGVFNGMTSQDVTMYFETFPSDRMELALQVESDRMANSIFDAGEVESERTVILSEREGAENSPFWLLTEEVQAAAYRVHSYHHPIIGWRSDLEAMQRDDLHRHYRTYYTPNNAVAVAVGDFAAGDMLDRIRRYFGPVPAGPAAPPLRLQEPAQNAERRVILRGHDQTAYLLQAFHTPPATHADFFPLTVMDAVLGGAGSMGLASGGNNRSNRLYKALVEQELAVGAGCSYQPAVDPTLFSFHATLAPGVEHRQVEDAIWAEIARIRDGGVTPAELEKAIKQTKAQFVYSRESVTYQGYWLGFSQVVASTAWLDTWVDQLSAVTSEDVQRVAADYFGERRQTVGWYVPLPDEEEGE
jgi:zinc protease